VRLQPRQHLVSVPAGREDRVEHVSRTVSMLPTEDLFTYVYVLVDDLIRAGAIATSA